MDQITLPHDMKPRVLPSPVPPTTSVPPPGDSFTPSMTGADELPRRPDPTDAVSVLADYAPYASIAADKGFQVDFHQYFQFLADCQAPDALFLLPRLDARDRSLAFVSEIFHEQVEYRGWLQLGHAADQIRQVEYFQQHYPEVYPIAHREATLQEMGLLDAYARRRGLPAPPELAYVLMSPMTEERSVSPARLTARLRHNPEIMAQRASLTTSDLEKAAAIFADGGYRYHDLPGLLGQAMEFLRTGCP